MIPTTIDPCPPSPFKKQLQQTMSLLKVNTQEDFLILGSNTAITLFPFRQKSETASNTFSMTSDSTQETTKEDSNFSFGFQSIDKELFVKQKEEIAIPTPKRNPKELLNMESENEKVYKKRKMQQHYIRFDYSRTVPCADVYEATDKDLDFLYKLNNEISDGYKISNKTPKITQAQFERLIELWESQTGEGPTISHEESLRTSETLDDLLSYEVQVRVYEYWKNLREEHRRPLLRKYWRAAHQDETNPNLAFQRRKENRFTRRRSQRMSSPMDDLKRMKTLKKNMDRSLLLLANVRYRDMLYLELQENKKKSFEEQIKTELGEDIGMEILNLGEKVTPYCEEESYSKMKDEMMEYSRKGEVVLNSIRRLKKKDQKNLVKISKEKIEQAPSETSTQCSVSPQIIPTKPLPFTINKFSTFLPRNTQGSFSLPIKKSMIEVKDLMDKLKQSLKELCSKNKENLKVKVDFGKSLKKPGRKLSIKGQKGSGKSPVNPPEEVTINIELEECLKHMEGGGVYESTTVKYGISFHDIMKKKKSIIEAVGRYPKQLSQISETESLSI